MTEQLIWLAVLPLPVACITWAVTREEILREPREWLTDCSENCRYWWQRKLSYAFTCDYCFSHYVALVFIVMTNYQLLMEDWRGHLIAWLAVTAVANAYLSLYSRLRVEIQRDKAQVKESESSLRRAG